MDDKCQRTWFSSSRICMIQTNIIGGMAVALKSSAISTKTLTYWVLIDPPFLPMLIANSYFFTTRIRYTLI